MNINLPGKVVWVCSVAKPGLEKAPGLEIFFAVRENLNVDKAFNYLKKYPIQNMVQLYKNFRI